MGLTASSDQAVSLNMTLSVEWDVKPFKTFDLRSNSTILASMLLESTVEIILSYTILDEVDNRKTSKSEKLTLPKNMSIFSAFLSL